MKLIVAAVIYKGSSYKLLRDAWQHNREWLLNTKIQLWFQISYDVKQKQCNDLDIFKSFIQLKNVQRQDA